MASSSQRVVVYIDGFNLYYGLKSKGWKRYYWLDLDAFATQLLQTGYSLEIVHYFTAKVVEDAYDPAKPMRQGAYLDALTTLPNVRVHYGYFLPKQQRCHSCGTAAMTYEEKMTDVNIAVKLIEDAHDDAFDTAILISGDGDLAGPVWKVQERFPRKRMVVAFPPNRVSMRLREVASAYFTIGRMPFRDSQMPEQIALADGRLIGRPIRWR